MLETLRTLYNKKHKLNLHMKLMGRLDCILATRSIILGDVFDRAFEDHSPHSLLRSFVLATKSEEKPASQRYVVVNGSNWRKALSVRKRIFWQHSDPEICQIHFLKLDSERRVTSQF